VPDSALPVFLTALALDVLPAALVLMLGGICWGATLAIIGILAAAGVTFASIGAAASLPVLLSVAPAPDITVPATAAVLEAIGAATLYWRFRFAKPFQRGARFWILTLHDQLHGAQG
jgi:hypothetical protein